MIQIKPGVILNKDEIFLEGDYVELFYSTDTSEKCRINKIHEGTKSIVLDFSKKYQSSLESIFVSKIESAKDMSKQTIVKHNGKSLDIPTFAFYLVYENSIFQENDIIEITMKQGKVISPRFYTGRLFDIRLDNFSLDCSNKNESDIKNFFDITISKIESIRIIKDPEEEDTDG